MRFGIAKDLVTPDVATYMGGYGNRHDQCFHGIHHDLYVKAVVLDDGRSKAVLITLDLLMHDFALTEWVADYANEKHGVPRDSVVLSYTHSHAGPALEGYDPGQASEHYEAFLRERITSCIDRAMVGLFEGTISFGTIQGDWNINRRRPVDGEIRLAPNPEGDKDNDLNILRIDDTQGNLKSLVLNYSCHPVTLGATMVLSAEYPGRLCQLLDARFYGCTTAFFQGAGGCSRPRVTAGGDRFKPCTFDDVDDMATVMANSVRKALMADVLAPLELDLAGRRFVVPLEVDPYPKSFFEARLAGAEADSSQRYQVEKTLARYDTSGHIVPLGASILRLSDDVFVALLCGEVCYPVKKLVAQVFGQRKLIFIGYGDGTAYIPDDTMLEQGGYEPEGSVVEFGLKGKFKAGINGTIADTFTENLAQLER